MRSGSNFAGSSDILTSKANEEIIPDKEKYYKFSIMIESDTTVSINGSDPIFIKGGVGFSTNQIDAQIRSFKILNDGVQFYWVGGN